MKKYLIALPLMFLCSFTFCQIAYIDSSQIKYIDTLNIKSGDFKYICKTVTKGGNNNNERLTLFYYWVYKNFTFDIDAFIKNTTHQNIEETLVSRKGLCYEYDDLLTAACKELKIPDVKIEGYVKFYGFTAGQKFSEANHVWHAVYLDNKWLLIDLLWACGNLTTENNSNLFKKKLKLAYFLAPPQNFLTTHLPVDPIWQFKNKPLSMAGFTSKTDGIDSTLMETGINYADSIIKFNSDALNERQINSAMRAYNFNSNNPDILITTYYNIAVELISKKSPTKIDLLNAKLYFTKSKSMISKTIHPEVLRLASECDRGILVSDRKIKEFKR